MPVGIRELAKPLSRLKHQSPSVVRTDKSSKADIRPPETTNDGLLVRLVAPVSGASLVAALGPALQTAASLKALRLEVDSLRKSLRDRKMIERAKGVLMERAALSEEKAYRRMQKIACDRNMTIVSVAETIMTAEKVLLVNTSAPIGVGSR